MRLSFNHQENDIKKPTEEFLREIFEPMGDLIDVAVKEYSMIQVPVRQEGYAFATFVSEESAETVIQRFSGFSKDGFTIDCTWSHRSNHLKKAEYFFQVRAASMGLPVPNMSTPHNHANTNLGSNLDGFSLEPLKLSGSQKLSSSPPLEQGHINLLPLRTQSNSLPESLRPSALDLDIGARMVHESSFESLSVPSASPSSQLLRNSLPTTGLLGSHSLSSSNISTLYSGSYSNTATPTSVSSRESMARYAAQHLQQRSMSSSSMGEQYLGNISELTGPTVASYRCPGTYGIESAVATPTHYNNHQHQLAREASHVVRSPYHQQRYSSQAAISAQGYPQMPAVHSQRHQTLPQRSYGSCHSMMPYGSDFTSRSVASTTHIHHGNYETQQLGVMSQSHGSYANTNPDYSSTQQSRQEPLRIMNSNNHFMNVPDQMDALKLETGNTVFNNFPTNYNSFHNLRSQDRLLTVNHQTPSLSAMAIHGELSDMQQPLKSISAFHSSSPHLSNINGNHLPSNKGLLETVDGGVIALGNSFGAISASYNPNTSSAAPSDDFQQLNMLRMRKM